MTHKVLTSSWTSISSLVQGQKYHECKIIPLVCDLFVYYIIIVDYARCHFLFLLCNDKTVLPSSLRSAYVTKKSKIK